MKQLLQLWSMIRAVSEMLYPKARGPVAVATIREQQRGTIAKEYSFSEAALAHERRIATASGSNLNSKDLMLSR